MAPNHSGCPPGSQPGADGLFVPTEIAPHQHHLIGHEWIRYLPAGLPFRERRHILIGMAKQAQARGTVKLTGDRYVEEGTYADRIAREGFRGVAVVAVSRNGLISMKRIAGRPQELGDIERLEAIS